MEGAVVPLDELLRLRLAQVSDELRPLYSRAADLMIEELFAASEEALDALVAAQPRTPEDLLAYLPGARERLRRGAVDPVSAAFRQRLYTTGH
jgi:hypothetical protein